MPTFLHRIGRTLGTVIPLIVCVVSTVLSSPRADGQMTTSQPARGPDKSIRIEARHVARMNEYLDRLEAFGFSGAVLVSQGEQVHMLRGCGEANRETGKRNTPDTLFDIGSLTKQFTAAAIVKLHTAGRLEFDDPITKHLKNVPEDKRAITIHQLLTHTSGLPAGVMITGEAETDRQRAIETILALPPQGPPGTRWSYSNAGYSLLACLIEEISGEGFEAHLKRTLFKPAGMRNAGFIGESGIDKRNVATGYNLGYVNGVVGPADEEWYHWGLRGAGGVLLNIKDIFQWELALQGTSVLSDDEKRFLFANHVQTYGPDSHYGYGWQLTDGLTDPHGCLDVKSRLISHGGDTRGFEAKYFRIPDDGIAVMVMGNNNDRFCWFAPMHLMSIFTDQDCPLPPAAVQLKAADLREWEGTYASADGIRISLRTERGKVLLTPVGQASFELIAMNGNSELRFKLAYKLANETAESFVRAWRTKDIDRLSAILDPECVESPEALIDRLDKAAAERGGYKSHAIIGTIVPNNAVHTLVEVRFANSVEKIRLTSGFGRISVVQFPLVYPIAVKLVPESASRVNSYVISSSEVRSLEWIDGKTPDRLRLTGFGGRIVELTRE